MSTFSNNLLYLRKKNGLQQPELAKKLGFKSFTTIQKWEDGTNEPHVSTLKLLSDLFNVSMEDLYNTDLTAPVSTRSADSSALTTEDAQECELLTAFRDLNDDGQTEAVHYVMDYLCRQDRYIKSHRDETMDKAQ